VRYQVTALDTATRLLLSSELVTPDARAGGEPGVADPRASRAAEVLVPISERVDEARVIRAFRTARSGLTIAAGMDHHLTGTTARVRTSLDPDRARVVFDVEASAAEPVELTKWLGYHYGPADAGELTHRSTLTLDRAVDTGYDAALEDHGREVLRFWDRSDVAWEGAPAAQQAVHYNLFTLLQASHRSEGHGVPAKGLTGTGYEGHYFWDSEMYVLPFLVHTTPQLARSLLMHRVRMLPHARRRAAEVGCAGALFPWRTISGEEASAYYAAGTAQYHINADIAYALTMYVHVTGDTDLLFRHGAELLAETARMWASLGFFSERRGGQFVIHKVTGPDEYTTVVDNNLFTNLMAAQNLTAAAEAVERLRAESPEDYRRLVERIGLRDEEPAAWQRAADRMYLPYDDAAGVHLQDDRFLDLKPWDFTGTPPDRYPLLLHYHPLVIYRHQVIKQADVVLATVVLPERFTPDERRRIFEYYDPLTTGDSSLSESIQAIAAADVGKYRTAEEYFVDAMAVDVADTAGNLRDGVHVASAGGSWMAIVYGFGGYRWRTTEFAPILPTRAKSLQFTLLIRGSVLEVCIEEGVVTYSVRSGDALTLRHHGRELLVAPGSPVSVPGEYRTRDATPPDPAPTAPVSHRGA
jgi:alpha,alpha-trehalose phosphorylase